MPRQRRADFSPRQADIMRLIAVGQSDKQIASQLGVSPRTIRTHLEKLYMQRGIRSRASAVNEWLRHEHELQRKPPEDECPFPRPFPEDFTACPAYQGREFVSLDLSDRPLASVRTCRHLISREAPAAPGRWYGACQLGDREARKRWAASIGVERLQKIGELQRDMARLTEPFVQALWALKGLELRERREGRDSTGTVENMKLLAKGLMDRANSFFGERPDLMQQLGLTQDAVMELIRVSLDTFISRPSAEISWQVPEAVLARFPRDTLALLGPVGSSSPWADR